MPWIKIESESKPRKTKESVFTMNFLPSAKTGKQNLQPLKFWGDKKGKERNNVWFLMKMFCTQSINEGQTWSVNNSLINEAHITATYCTLPALESSSTDWSYLYTCLKLAEKLNTLVSPAQKTIVSLDLQLYSKCIQL